MGKVTVSDIMRSAVASVLAIISGLQYLGDTFSLAEMNKTMTGVFR